MVACAWLGQVVMSELQHSEIFNTITNTMAAPHVGLFPATSPTEDDAVIDAAAKLMGNHHSTLNHTNSNPFLLDYLKVLFSSSSF